MASHAVIGFPDFLTSDDLSGEIVLIVLLRDLLVRVVSQSEKSGGK